MKAIFSPCTKFNHIESCSLLLNLLSHAFDKVNIIFDYTWKEGAQEEQKHLKNGKIIYV